VPKSWTLLDFFLVVLGGFLGAAAAGAVGALLGGEDEAFIALALLGQYVGHLLVLWLLSSRKDHPELGFAVEGRDSLYIGVGLLLQIALSVLFLPLSSLLFPDAESAQQVGTTLAGLETTTARITAILTAVVLAPVTEEAMFRGILLKSQAHRSNRAIMVITALVFSVFHVLGLDPSRMLEAAAVVLPQLFLVGLVLAWVTLRTGRLGPAIFIHSGFNLLAAIVLLLPEELLDSVS
jgi:membrane protease YdiL (CAAX protease family)